MSNEMPIKNDVRPVKQKPKFINNSGGGKDIKVPKEISGKFNWGAFTLTWIWGIGNKSYITFTIFASALLAIIPIIGMLGPLGFSIWFGIKGNTWAWQNKRFPNIKSFHENQKKWAIIGISIYIISSILSFIIFSQFMNIINNQSLNRLPM